MNSVDSSYDSSSPSNSVISNPHVNEGSSKGKTFKKVLKRGWKGAVALGAIAVVGLIIASATGASPAVLKGFDFVLYGVGGVLGVGLVGYLGYHGVRNRETAFTKSVLVQWLVIALLGAAAISVFALNARAPFLSPTAFKVAEGIAIGVPSLLVIQNIVSMDTALDIKASENNDPPANPIEKPKGFTKNIHATPASWEQAMNKATPSKPADLATDHVKDNEAHEIPQLPMLTVLEGEREGESPEPRMGVRLPSTHAHVFHKNFQEFLGPEPEVYHLVFDNTDLLAKQFSFDLHAMALPEHNPDDPKLKDKEPPPGVEVAGNGLTTVTAVMETGGGTIAGTLTDATEKYPQTLSQSQNKKETLPNVEKKMTFEVDPKSPVSQMYVVAEVRGRKMGFFIQVLNDKDTGDGKVLEEALNKDTVGEFVEELKKSEKSFVKKATVELYKFEKNRIINGKYV
ncbi:MAG: hypothetical protein K940chlam9_00453 [Chlamydiae bacterium]|nr:hypothetical protein [Chlamydiota bacterium]